MMDYRAVKIKFDDMCSDWDKILECDGQMDKISIPQETQLSLTNRATRLDFSLMVPNMVPFHMLGMVSY